MVTASIVAAYMSTIGTHLNWGSSYVVNDFYKRFVNPEASERRQVSMGRGSTALLMIISAVFSLTFLQNATQAFDILLLSGAGTGMIYLLRWFWWRINALSEITGMVAATVMAVLLVLVIGKVPVALLAIDAQGLTDDLITQAQAATAYDVASWQQQGIGAEGVAVLQGIGSQAAFNTLVGRINTLVFPVRLLLCVVVVSACWLLATFLGKPEDMAVLKAFYQRTQPGGPGWRRVRAALENEGNGATQPGADTWQMPKKILLVFMGCVSIYTCLFAIGSLLYGHYWWAAVLFAVSVGAALALFKVFQSLNNGQPKPPGGAIEIAPTPEPHAALEAVEH